MNFKKKYEKANGYTPICKIGEGALKKLEFGIIELEAGQRQDFDTMDKETAFIMLEGHCNVIFGDTCWEKVGNRANVFENRKAESFYMPKEQKHNTVQNVQSFLKIYLHIKERYMRLI